MKTKTKFKSDIKEAIHSSASALYLAGVINKVTMRSFDESCLSITDEFKPDQIKKMRIASKMSQPVFARHLNTSESTVEKWETGAKRPSGTALKLLSIVQKHGVKILQV